jgi:dipeptidase E
VTNESIRHALIGMLGKPIAESDALFIPTAQWGQPACDPVTVWKSTADRWEDGGSLVGLGWRSVGVLELTALPTIPEERWMRWVRDADVLLVDGGEARYLFTWMQRSGLASLLTELSDTVWVGVSAGSMVMTPRVGEEFVETKPSITGSDRTLGVVPFSIFPHLDHPGFDENTMACAERWAARIGGPAYAIDDQTGIQVVDGRAEVVSEGRWRYFGPEAGS